jgi:isopenicillin-N N-acyltransferase-like protein
MPDSLYRDRRVRELLRPQIGSLTVADVKAALLDNWATPWSVCRPPRPSLTTNLSATVVTLIMQPASGRMEIAVLPALDSTFTNYTLER